VINRTGIFDTQFSGHDQLSARRIPPVKSNMRLCGTDPFTNGATSRVGNMTISLTDPFPHCAGR
jgi:hypothetical protein